MYLRTLLNSIFITSKIIIYNEAGNLIFAGERSKIPLKLCGEIGTLRVKHIAPLYNEQDGPYLSITVKTGH